MIVLALDSTTPSGSVAIGVCPDFVPLASVGEAEGWSGPPSAIQNWREPWTDVYGGDPDRPWSTRLPGDLLAMLDGHGLKPSDVSVFAVATGPGSLTGLRVGIATIQGLALATGRPVAAVSALEAIAELGCRRVILGERRALQSDDGGAVTSQARHLVQDAGPVFVGAWTNALRGEVFHALYRPRRVGQAGQESSEPVLPAAVSTPDAAVTSWSGVVGNGSLLVIGDVDAAMTAGLREMFGNRLALQPRPLLAGELVRVAVKQARAGTLGSPHSIRPTYVRKPDAVLARERSAAMAGRASTAER